MRRLTQESIENIALGAAVLGTGGGGDPYIGKLMALEAIRKYGDVEVITVDELGEDDHVVPVSMIGAPTVMIEKIPSEEQIIAPLELIEQTIGKRVGAVMPIEVGGVNSLIPIIAAAIKGIPLLDADAMGRAFPESQMVSFHIDGYSPAPVAIADEKGNTGVLYPADGLWSEKLARALTIQLGGSASICDYCLPSADIRKSVIPGTLTLSEQIGQTLRNASKMEGSPIERLLELIDGFQLIKGKITTIERRIDGGFTKGQVAIEGMDDDKNRTVTLFFQNEHLLATEDGRPLAITPDLIAILDQETGFPITTESMKYGARVAVVAFPCHAKWRTAKGIETAGPRYFGYEYEYQPVELLNQKEVE